MWSNDNDYEIMKWRRNDEIMKNEIMKKWNNNNDNENGMKMNNDNNVKIPIVIIIMNR